MIPVPRRPGRMSRQLHAPKQIFLLGPGEIRKVNSGQSTWFGRQCRPPDPGGFDIEALFGSAGYGRRAIAQRRRTLLEQPALARETRSVHRHCAALRGAGASIRTGSLLLHRPPHVRQPAPWRGGRAELPRCLAQSGLELASLCRIGRARPAGPSPSRRACRRRRELLQPMILARLCTAPTPLLNADAHQAGSLNVQLAHRSSPAGTAGAAIP